MKQSSSVLPKPNKGGRPATGRDPVRAFRLSDKFLAKLDDWSASQEDQPGRSEALRRLVEIGLSVPAKAKPTTDKARRAASVAAEKHAHEHMDSILKDEPHHVRAERKKRLTSLPGGFKRR